MSTLTALARLRAARTGRAERLCLVRHHHLVDEPLVLVVLNLAGEAAAPLACMVGTDRDDPVTLTVPQPRNRDLRQEFYSGLAAVVLPYIAARAKTLRQIPAEGRKPARELCTDAPQIIVANQPTVKYLRLMGRSTRFQRLDEADGDPSVARLGQWLTFFAERAEYPGSSLLLALTEQLTAHWATGQSRLEDANLSALLAWIAPPDGLTGAQAALEAENPVDFPPAGPATDPTFDVIELEPRMRAYDEAVAAQDEAAAEEAAGKLRAALKSQLEPTWKRVWEGLDLLRGIPEAAGCKHRWDNDCERFTGLSRHIEDGGAPQPVHDKAVDAAIRLASFERAQNLFDDQRALDDPFVLAERRTTGDAFGGVVTERDPDHWGESANGNPVRRPRFTVRTQDPPPFDFERKLVSPKHPGKTVRICDMVPDGPDAHLIVLELVSGMGRKKELPPDVVPGMGEMVCYTAAPSWRGAVKFPDHEQTPWTHGGPPPSPEIQADPAGTESP